MKREEHITEFEKVHGRSDYQFPQLEMVRPGLSNLPPLELPSGYSIRHFMPGDEAPWGKIMSEAFNPYWDAARFLRLMKPHFGFRPERVLFLCKDGKPIGSASAYQWPGIRRDRGYIHMLGIKKEHCGMGLGRQLAIACLHRFREEGFRDAMLQTEDFRIPAIKHYLRLGFSPVLVREDQRVSWERILRRIGGQELVREKRLHELKTMNRLTFWWRTMLTVNYMSWLNLTGGFRARK